MRRAAAPSVALFVSLAIAACASSPPLPPRSSGDVASASAPVADGEAPQRPIETTAGDPRVVRCGVDDAPKNVVGAVDFFEPPSSVPMGTEGAFLGASIGLGRPSKIMVAQPRPPSVRTVPLARPRSSASFESATRLGSLLDEPTKTAVVGRIFDVSACIGEGTVPPGGVVIQLRVASSGAPLEARPKSSDLDERATHCVVELGCRLTLPPTPGTSDLEIRSAVTQKAPVFKGNVSVNTSAEGAYVEAMQPALSKLGLTLKPLAEECAKKHPPALTLSLQQRLSIDDAGYLSLVPPTIGGATEALMTCLAPRLHDAIGPVAPALRKAGGLRTSFSFVVPASP